MGLIKEELFREEYKIICKHISKVVPKEFHIARAIYFNNVKEFNPAKVSDLPQGFVIENFIELKNNIEKC